VGATASWKNLDPESRDAEGQAHSRFAWLMRDDPFASMLSVQVRDALPAALYHNRFREDGTFWKYSSVKSWSRVIEQNVKSIPYARLWTDEFKGHLVYLAVIAIMPEGDKERED
jgi:hypothetical protein